MLYNIARMIVGAFLTLAFRITYSGTQNIPASGPVIVASNHMSFWDPPVIGCGLTRHIHYMAKEELFANPLFAWIITRLKAFPVKRGTADRGAIKMALTLLNEGKVLGLFPEGTRSKDGQLGKPEMGLALLAAKSGAIIIPAAIIGTNKIFQQGSFFPKVEVRFGEPILLEKGNTAKEYLEQKTGQMMTEIAALLGGEYNG